MTAVRHAVTEVLLRHGAEARVEVSIRVRPTALLHHRTVQVDVMAATETTDDAGAAASDEHVDDVDQVRAYQEARFRALEL